MRRTNKVRAAWLALGLGCVPASSALAGGFEYPGLGPNALGRGGAYAVRADSPMALGLNPAMLAWLDGSQLTLQANVGFLDACMTRSGNYLDNITGLDVSDFGNSDNDATWYDYNTGNGKPFPKVCNDGPPGPGLGLAFSYKLMDNLGLAVGVLTPAGVGHTVWGDPEKGTVKSGGVLLPTPTRYQLIEAQPLILYPTVGIGYSPHPMVSFGASLMWGIASMKFRNNLRAIEAENPASDFRADLEASDFFIPGFIGSVQVRPMDGLEIMAGVRWSDNVKGRGSLDLTWAPYGADVPESTKTTLTKIDDVRLSAPQPWQIMGGIRYGHKLPEGGLEEGAIRDPMSLELFDLEFDFQYEFNSVVDNFVINIPAGSRAQTPSYAAGLPLTATDLTVELPTYNESPHRWKDQVSLRLGGDYNILRNQLAARAGFSYESSGVDERFAGIDFWNGERYGLHLGATYRVARLDISLAYAHFFQTAIDVSPTEANYPQLSANEACTSRSCPLGRYTGRIVNAGKYESSLDVLSLGVNYHF